MDYPYNLSLHRYQLIFQLPENMDTKNIFGSKIRGILGEVLEKTQPEVFKNLYEKVRLPENHPASIHIGVTHSPSPFMFCRVFLQHLPKNQIAFMLTLFGDYHKYFPTIYQAFENLNVLKNDSSNIVLMSVEKMACTETGQFEHQYQEIAEKVKDFSPNHITLSFRSPLILAGKDKGLLTDFSFLTILKYLHRRAALLSTVFGETRVEIKEYSNDTVNTEILLSNIQMVQKKVFRSPGAKKEYMKNTFTGQLGYEGNLQPWLPLLVFGQYTHIGSDTAFGLGNYELR